MGTSGYSSNKRSNGYESHELSSNSKPSRLGFRSVKDPYNVSVLQTQRNESEERIISGKQNNGIQRAPSQTSDQSDQRLAEGITVKREVDISTVQGKQGFHQNWKAV